MSKYYARWNSGFEVIWRDLTWAEYRRFKKIYDTSPFDEPMEVAIEIYKLVRLNGPDPSFAPAGIPGFICKQQMINNPFSGSFEDINPAIEIARKLVSSNYLISAKALIASTLNYKIEEIDGWDSSTFFIRLAQTEIATGRTFDPVNPKTTAIPNKLTPQITKKNLSPSQQKAIIRAKEERGRG
jgi:hypothetical protein